MGSLYTLQVHQLRSQRATEDVLCLLKSKRFFDGLQSGEDSYVRYERLIIGNGTLLYGEVRHFRHSNKTSVSYPVMLWGIVGRLLVTSFISPIFNATNISIYMSCYVGRLGDVYPALHHEKNCCDFVGCFVN